MWLYHQAQPKGFLGALRERGVGGSRCGATAATVVLFPLQGTETMFPVDASLRELILNFRELSLYDNKVLKIQFVLRW